MTYSELGHVHFLNNLIKKNIKNEFRSDLFYNLNIKQIKNFLIKDFKILIPKFHKKNFEHV